MPHFWALVDGKDGKPIAVALVAFHAASRRAASRSGRPFQLPTSKVIERVSSAALLFGAGWGLAGLCPGPAVVNLGDLNQRAALFVLAMAAGMPHRAMTSSRSPSALLRTIGASWSGKIPGIPGGCRSCRVRCGTGRGWRLGPWFWNTGCACEAFLSFDSEPIVNRC
jgi:uncharacterized membrane protein YedE/YeeE